VKGLDPEVAFWGGLRSQGPGGGPCSQEHRPRGQEQQHAYKEYSLHNN
jgi:hypothetical protein